MGGYETFQDIFWIHAIYSFHSTTSSPSTRAIPFDPAFSSHDRTRANLLYPYGWNNIMCNSPEALKNAGIDFPKTVWTCDEFR